MEPSQQSPLLLPENEHKQLVVIDFEYASANTRGLEFANHFVSPPTIGIVRTDSADGMVLQLSRRRETLGMQQPPLPNARTAAPIHHRIPHAQAGTRRPRISINHTSDAAPLDEHTYNDTSRPQRNQP